MAGSRRLAYLRRNHSDIVPAAVSPRDIRQSLSDLSRESLLLEQPAEYGDRNKVPESVRSDNDDVAYGRRGRSHRGLCRDPENFHCAISEESCWSCRMG